MCCEMRGGCGGKSEDVALRLISDMCCRAVDLLVVVRLVVVQSANVGARRVTVGISDVM